MSTTTKEMFDKYINIPVEEVIKRNVYSQCRHMNKEDICEWIYQDELEIKKYKEAIDKIRDAIKNKVLVIDIDTGNIFINQNILLDILKKVE